MRRFVTRVVVPALITALTLIVAGCEDDNPNCVCPLNETGTILINPSPDHLHARWVLTGPDNTYVSGRDDQFLADMPPGAYSVTWRQIWGWETPPDEMQDLAPDSIVIFNGAYAAIGTGSFVVNPSPDHLNASWTIVGPDGWRLDGNGDQTINDLLPGEYTITWHDEPNWSWLTPESETRMLTENATETLTGVYIENIPTPFVPGNILLSSRASIREYDRSGDLVQEFAVGHPSGASGDCRDIAIDELGYLYAYNGTFSPWLSVFDPSTNDWTHYQFDGWSTVANSTYGGIGILESFVYLTDMSTAQGGGPRGIIRFNKQDMTWERFASEDYIDLCIGEDGLLYALYPGGTPSGRTIDVFDPQTMDRLSTFGTPEHVSKRRIIATESEGIYLSLWDNAVQNVSLSGDLIETIDLSPAILSTVHDLDRTQLGEVVVVATGTFAGDVLVWFAPPFPTGGSTSIDVRLSGSSGFVIWVPEYSR